MVNVRARVYAFEQWEVEWWGAESCNIYVGNDVVFFWPRFADWGRQTISTCQGWSQHPVSHPKSVADFPACYMDVDLWVVPTTQNQFTLNVGCMMDGAGEEYWGFTDVEVRAYFSTTNPPEFRTPVEKLAFPLSQAIDQADLADLGFFSEMPFNDLDIHFTMLELMDAQGSVALGLLDPQSVFQLTAMGTLRVLWAEPLQAFGPGQLTMQIEVTDGRDSCVIGELIVAGPCRGATNISLMFVQLDNCPEGSVSMTLQSSVSVGWAAPSIAPAYVTWSQTHVPGTFAVGDHIVTYSIDEPSVVAIACSFRV